eukprot:226478-Chlamydomonas_euryale.AAC.2
MKLAGKLVRYSGEAWRRVPGGGGGWPCMHLWLKIIWDRCLMIEVARLARWAMHRLVAPTMEGKYVPPGGQVPPAGAVQAVRARTPGSESFQQGGRAPMAMGVVHAPRAASHPVKPGGGDAPRWQERAVGDAPRTKGGIAPWWQERGVGDAARTTAAWFAAHGTG